MPTPLKISFTAFTEGPSNILVLHAEGSLLAGSEGNAEVGTMGTRLGTELAGGAYQGLVLNFLRLHYEWGDALAGLWVRTRGTYKIPVVVVAVGETRKAIGGLLAFQIGAARPVVVDSIVEALAKIQAHVGDARRDPL